MASTNKTPKMGLSQFDLQDKLKMSDYNEDMLAIDTKAMTKEEFDPSGEITEAGGILNATDIQTKDYVNSYVDSYVTPIVEEIEERIATFTAITGQVTTYAGMEVPDGWLLCDGSVVSRSEYEQLFDVIGTTYGAGDGATTFAVPDLRDRFAMGVSTSNKLAQKGGEAKHTLSVAEMPSHNHSIAYAKATAQSQDLYPISLPNQSRNYGFTQLILENRGGGAAHNNIPPYVSLNYIIKT